jgi:hypothetical protein
MTSTRLLFCLLILLMSVNIYAQKILKLDTPKDPSRMVFRIGSVITFQLDGEKDIWYSDRILDFDTDKGWLIFETWRAHVGDISAVKRQRGGFIQRLPIMLKVFGVSAVFFGTVGRLTTCNNCDQAVIVGGSSFLIGWLLGKIFKPKVYKINDRNKLRLLDLTLTPKPVTV